MGQTILEHQGPDGDTRVHDLTKPDMTDAPSVWTSAHRLQLINDLHGSGPGGPRYRASGECGSQQVKERTLFGQATRHVRHQVHHVRVAFNAHPLIDPHTAFFTHLLKVIAAEIDQHEMLCALFLIGKQLAGELSVLLGVAPSGACTSDWAHRYLTSPRLNHELGRRAYQLKAR